MGFLNSIDISASGLTAQRLRLDTIASNMANVETTRAADGEGPYRRQVVVFQAKDPTESYFRRKRFDFRGILREEENKIRDRDRSRQIGQGVRAVEIREVTEEEAPYRRAYEPSHPEADEEGYVNYPNVNIVEEMINMISATRAYEANAQVIEASKTMAMKALSMGQ